MKLAIIDIGTNTFNLLLQDSETGEMLFSDKRAVKLGEGGINQNKITPEAFERGMEALADYRQEIMRHQADEVYVFATSAVRGAENQNAFIQSAFDQFGVCINLIDGAKEAELIYEGVKHAVDLGKETHLIMDIGGGSTEFIFSNAKEAFWKKSFNIGTSRLQEIFKPTDPVSDENVKAIDQYLKEQLSDLVEAQQKHRARVLVGSSGSFETFAEMIMKNDPREKSEPIHTSYSFNLESFKRIAEKMKISNLEERLNTPGMIPMRADMVVMATLLINFVLKHLEINQMKLSTYALKEGVFYSITEKEHQWQRSSL